VKNENIFASINSIILQNLMSFTVLFKGICKNIQIYEIELIKLSEA